jgi:DNA-binding LytR/AlgR family response regulator
VVEIDLKIIESEEYEEIQIVIKCSKIDRRMKHIIETIEQSNISLYGEKDGRIYSLEPESLYYIESVDNKTFVYTKNEVYENNLKLYELVERLQATSFIRISKNLIVNINYIKSVRALINGKFEALLTNEEICIVNRHYVKSFKEKFIT